MNRSSTGTLFAKVNPYFSFRVRISFDFGSFSLNVLARLPLENQFEKKQEF
ncbi:MAG: hypothetical protein ACTSXP_09620 [Promethearchaeota archaeon]